VSEASLPQHPRLSRALSRDPSCCASLDLAPTPVIEYLCIDYKQNHF
jgi:hypothetical protein